MKKDMTGQTFYARVVKRGFDIVLCGLALVILSPLFLITAAAIRLSSPGPVFYASDRVGINGELFHFFKFRSMHVTNADKGLHVADADRVFPVGKIIRRLKIDELPQLVNVIRGDMSIVGPRPMVTASLDEMYGGKYRRVLTVRPGLTSAASLYDYTVGDTYTDEKAYMAEIVPMKSEMELYYVERQSFAYDAQLVGRTIVTILAVLFHARLPEQKEYTLCRERLNAAE